MSIFLRARFLFVLLFLSFLATPLLAQQSHNNVLNAVPVPKNVKPAIDGDLSEWDTSGRIIICRDVGRQLNKYSAALSMMYDADALYVGVDWSDPTPMVNNYDPRFDVDLRYCFHSDSLQLHFKTDQERKVINWFYTKGNTPGVNVLDGWFPWGEKKITYIDGIVKLGITAAFQPKKDGKGYFQEMRIPWAAIVKSGKAFAAGSEFECMLDLVWGPDSGKGWPINHMMDLVQPNAVHAGWFWEVQRMYGKVKLSPTGNLTLPEPEFLIKARLESPRLQATAGPIKLPYEMPFDGFATLVIENEKGERIRNLIGMAPRRKGPQSDLWDCLDEAGKLVPPGNFRFRGLVHQGINPTYEATYGTPGNPPWDTADGTGAWLSDHCAPRAVAASKDIMILAAEMAESGNSIIGVDLDGQKKWGESTIAGIHSLAADEKYVYLYLHSWQVKPSLARMDVKNGSYAPFSTADGPKLKLDLFVDIQKTIDEYKAQPGAKPADAPNIPWVSNIAVGPDRIALSVGGDSGIVRFFDKNTGAVTTALAVPKLGYIAYDPSGVLFVWSDNKICKVVDDKLIPVLTQNLPVFADGFAIDAQGQFFLNVRAQQQVRVYDHAGKLLRSIGLAGGRPQRGKWEPNGLLNPISPAIDTRGRLWIAEENMTPKRVSVWTADGKLVRDFIGPATYGGTGAIADPADKTRVFGSGCEFKLDYKNNTATIVSALGTPEGQIMKAHGRDYFMSKQGSLSIRTGDTLRPVAAMAAFRAGEADQYQNYNLPKAPEGTHGYATQSFLWMDANDNGKPDAGETVSGSTWDGWKNFPYPLGTAGYFGSYWLDENFNLYGFARESYGGQGGRGPFVTKMLLTGWTAGGAPIWDFKKQQLIIQPKLTGPNTLYLPTDGCVIVGAPITAIRDDGHVLWTYKDQWTGVHDSHHSPLPERDDTLIGVLGCIGSAKSPLGTVFAMHSNLGRLYLMTVDGLLVASVFEDCRLGGASWPKTAIQGASLSEITMGSEWFGGHFFKAEKSNEYYLIAGFTAFNLIKLHGFDSLRAVALQSITVNAAQLAEAQILAQTRAAAAAAKLNKTFTVSRVDAPPKLLELPKEKFTEWSSGPYKSKAALALDKKNLYLAFDVSGDDNPMVNAGKDANQLFVTGDSIDLQLATDLAADPKRTDAAPGDIRLLISVFEGKPIAVLYRFKTKGEKSPVTFVCPWRSYVVDRVDILKNAEIKITRRQGGYTVEASLPLADLNFAPEPGKSYPADLGVIYSDSKGDNRAMRLYWSNQTTGLISDIPGEIMPNPSLWSKIQIAPE